MPAPSFEIVETVPGDAAAILEMTRRAAVFSAEEVATVDELLTDRFTQGAAASGYYFITCRAAGRPVGFACYGPRPLTQGTFDLYWIVTDPTAQQRGVGRALLRRTVQEVRALGGYLLVAETSGRAPYAPARRFYERTGFDLAAHIADFYEPGDDLKMYVLRLDCWKDAEENGK